MSRKVEKHNKKSVDRERRRGSREMMKVEEEIVGTLKKQGVQFISLRSSLNPA